MVKKKANQLPAGERQEEYAQELDPQNDQETAEEFAYQSPAEGMNKKQQQQKKS